MEGLTNALPPNVSEFEIQSQGNVEEHFILTDTRTQYIPYKDYRSGKREGGGFPASILKSWLGERVSWDDVKTFALYCDICQQGRREDHTVYYTLTKENPFSDGNWELWIDLHTDSFFFRDVKREEYNSFNQVIDALRKAGYLEADGTCLCDFPEVEGMGLLPSGLEVPSLDEFDLQARGIAENEQEKPSQTSMPDHRYQEVALFESECEALQSLEAVTDHPIRHSSGAAGKRGFTAELGHVTSLDIGYFLKAMPDIFENFPNLRTLRLYGHKLELLPPSLGKATRLRELCLNWNALEKFLPSVGQLIRLRYLLLKENRLDELPEDFGALAALAFLDLESNCLKQLPTSFSQLSHLVALDLSHNQLATLPPHLENLRSLRYLNLMGNKLKELPDALGHLANLRTLNIRNNKIHTLPPSILSSSILWVPWDGTPLDAPSRAIVQEHSARVKKTPFYY